MAYIAPRYLEESGHMTSRSTGVAKGLSEPFPQFYREHFCDIFMFCGEINYCFYAWSNAYIRVYFQTSL